MRIRPTRVEIDLGAVRHNLQVIREVAGVPVVAVVKAGAYGHGAPAVAASLEGAGVAGFAVSLVEEGVALRDAGVRAPILVLGPALDGGHEELVARELTAMISDPADLAALAAIGRRRGRPVDVHLKVDTGMNRLGLPDAGIGELAARARDGGGVTIAGLATHLACADLDDPGDPGSATAAQLARFAAAEAAVRAAGVAGFVRHVANSSGAMAFPDARLDRVRVGLALYGNGRWPADDALAARGAARRPVMRLVTEIAQVRTVAAGAAVGYDALWRAERDTPVAVLPLGYADGLPRRASGHAHALIRGRRCPLVGAISMDLAVADVAAVPGKVAPGDEVVLLGVQGADRITAAEYGAWAGLTEYEVTCGVSRRVPRLLQRGGG
jgi:alanine racemase